VIITAASTLTGVLTTIAAVSGIVQGRSQYSITAAGRIRGFSPSVHRGLTSAATIGRELVSVGHSREGES
jgi:hypothetical protein